MRTRIGAAPIRHATPFEKLTCAEQEAVKRCFPGRERFVYEVTGDFLWISARDGDRGGGIKINRYELTHADESRLDQREREAMRKFFPSGQLLAVRDNEVVIMVQPNGFRPFIVDREHLRNHDIELFCARPAPELGIAIGIVLIPIFDD
jgi:hypothetical protein